MFKIARPKPVFYPAAVPANSHAVLLLHGFTGSPLDLKKLTNFLKNQGCACYSPIYSGHGLGAEALITTGVDQWWHDALNAFEFLKSHGYQKISIIGHSMGGVFALRLAQQYQLSGVTTLCSPIQKRPVDNLKQRLINYAREYKKFEQKSTEHIEQEVSEFANSDFSVLQGLSDFTETTGHHLEKVNCPVQILQGELDDLCYQDSAALIYQQVSSSSREIKTYPNSGHMLMQEADHHQVFRDIVAFLGGNKSLNTVA